MALTVFNASCLAKWPWREADDDNKPLAHGYSLLTYIGHIVAGGGHTLTDVD